MISWWLSICVVILLVSLTRYHSLARALRDDRNYWREMMSSVSDSSKRFVTEVIECELKDPRRRRWFG